MATKAVGYIAYKYTSSTDKYISANADEPRDAASRKIDHIALPTEHNYQETSVGR